MKIKIKAITKEDVTRFFIVINDKEKEIGRHFKDDDIEVRRKFLEDTMRNFAKLNFKRNYDYTITSDYLENAIIVFSNSLDSE